MTYKNYFKYKTFQTKHILIEMITKIKQCIKKQIKMCRISQIENDYPKH